MNKELYDNHIKNIFGVKKIEEFSEMEVDEAFNLLLQLLPNGGKLYKYRSFEKGKFENYYDALKSGYLWFPQADKLNDDFDTILYFDPCAEAENIKNYLLENPRLYFKAILSYSDEPIKIGYSSLDHKAFNKVMDCYDLNNGKLDESKAIKLLLKMGIELAKAKRYIIEVDTFIEQFILNNKEAIEEVVKSFININKTIRSSNYIYSMSETYQSNPLWAFYCNNNQGFCIEYDFTKSKDFDIEKKRMIINTFAVKYNDEVKDYTFVNMLKWLLTGKRDDGLLLKANLDLFTQLMTKQADWAFEREWRIMLANLEDNKVAIDLVSGIIIDERVLETGESKKLISLCKERDWTVLVRKTQFINAAHKFEKLG